MPRVSEERLQKLNAFIDSLPAEARSKCALCTETLTHIVKTAEVETGAGTATVTRVLADRINDGAAPLDRVSGQQLRRRVQRVDDPICPKRANKPAADDLPDGGYDVAHGGEVVLIKAKKQISQEAAWRTALKKITAATEYMMKHCRVDADMSDDLSAEIKYQFRLIETFMEEMGL